MPLTLPTVVHEPDTEDWFFTWPDQNNRVGQLVVGISNLRESSAGVHADLEIEAENRTNGTVHTYHVFGPKSLNLKGPNSARDIVKILAGRTKGDIDSNGIPQDWW